MPGDPNLVSYISSQIRIDFNASIFVVAAGISESLAAPVLSVLHTPFPFPETPPFSLSPNHKRPCGSNPSTVPRPLPNVAVLQGKEAGPGAGWGRSVAPSFRSSANR